MAYAIQMSMPRREVLGDSVYESLKEVLMDNRLEPGARLGIDPLSRQLGVSPTPVREALARLEAERLVSKEPLRGYRVAPLLDERALDDLYEIRLLLEPRAARRAATRWEQADLRALELASERMRRAGRAAGGSYARYREFADGDASFHDALAVASGNDALRETLARLRPHLQLYRLGFDSVISADTLAEHESVLEAVRARDADAAERATALHVDRSRERLRPVTGALANRSAS